MKKFDWREVADLEKSYYSERVVLRPLMECDVYPLFLATTEPAFNRYLLWDAPSSVSQLADRIKTILDERRKGQMGAWVAADITTGAFVALFRAFTVEPPDGLDELHVETGIWLHPSFWLGGLSVEVTAMSYDFLFDETPAEVLYAATHRENRAGLGLFRGLKLEFVGNSVAEHENGTQVPAYLYQARRKLWQRTVDSRENYEEIAATREALVNGFVDYRSTFKAKRLVL